MQIHVPAHAQPARRAEDGMRVDEFLARFPEVPRELRDEPVLARVPRRAAVRLPEVASAA